MTIDERLWSAVLTANAEEQRKFHAAALGKAVFSASPALSAWVINHRERHGAYPSLALTRSKFPSANLARVKDSWQAALEPVLAAHALAKLQEINAKIKPYIERGDYVRALEEYKTQAAQLKFIPSECEQVDYADGYGAYADYLQSVRSGYDSIGMTGPWPTLAKAVGEFEPAETILLASRTSIGKTWLTLWWALHAAQSRRVLYITKEMSVRVISRRINAIVYGLPYDDFRRRELNPAQLRRLRDSTVQKPNIVVAQDRDNTLASTAAMIANQRVRPDMVVVDGAYLITDSTNYKSDTELFRRLSGGISRMAKQNSVTVLATLQQNRNAENAQGKSSSALTSVYGSDAWAQDCDFLIGIGGERGAPTRSMQMLKGRETKLGNWSVKFELSPKPDFSECSPPTEDEALAALKKIKAFTVR